MSKPPFPSRSQIVLAISLIGPFSAAQAQQATPPAGAASAPTAGKLETVTVTAERREENIKDVPVSVFSLSGEKLDVLNSSGQDVRFLSSRVPSLNIESSFGRAFPRFYIRGYGNTDFRANASQPVSLIYDDIVQENPLLKGFPAFDLDRIEVLAGPQGTLFGRNTPAGVVKFDSVKPVIGSRDGYGSLSFGTYKTTNAEAAISVPLGAEWAGRVSVQGQYRDDWVDNTFEGSPTQELEGYKDGATRVQLLYKPSGGFSALFNLHARYFTGSARLFRGNIFEVGSNDLKDDFDEDEIANDGRNWQRVETYGGNARLRWDIDQYSLHSITGIEKVHSYSRGDIDGTAGPYDFFGPSFVPGETTHFPSETAGAIHGHHQFTQEFRVESRYAGPFNWQAGVYYFNEDYDALSFNYNSLGGRVLVPPITTDSQKNDAAAVFGSVRYDVTPRLNLRAGLRYTKDKKDLDSDPDALPVPSQAEGTSASTDDSKVNGDLSATYAVTPDTNVYARVATGYRGSSIQPASAFGTQSQAEPENTTSFEVGVKADLFDRRARLAFDVFRYTVKDIQLTAVGGSSNSNRLLNADKAVGQGFELSLDAYLTDNLLVTLSGSYNDTEIKDNGLAVPGCGGGCTMTSRPVLDSNGDPTGNFVIDGNPLPQAPKWIGNFTARYGIPTPDGEWFIYTDWAYRSKINFFLYEAKEFTGKPLLEGGLRIGYNWADGNYELAAFGRNITNKIVAVGGIDFTNITGFINEPRTLGVQFRARF